MHKPLCSKRNLKELAEPQAKQSLSSEKMSSDECSICLEPLPAEPSAAVVKLACGHLFHRSCVQKMRRFGVETAQTCPLCRAPLPPGCEELLAQAGLANARGKTEEALRLLREALNDEPDNHSALNNLGAVLLDSGALAEAEAHLDRLVKLNPSHVLGLTNLAVIRFDQARAHLTRTPLHTHCLKAVLIHRVRSTARRS